MTTNVLLTNVKVLNYCGTTLQQNILKLLYLVGDCNEKTPARFSVLSYLSR